MDLLSKEEVCKNFKEKEEGKIDFKTVKSSSAKNSDDSNKTFCRTKYCQPCPLCGMKKNNNGEWEHKKKGKCTSGNLYRPIDGAIHTDINFLYSGDRHDDIEKKLNRFCDETNGDTINSVAGVSGTGVVAGSNSRSKELYQEWKCYKGKDVEKVKDGKDEDDEDYEDDYHKEVENAGGLCILENNDGKEKVNKQKTYNDFFYYWVAHMLKDSIHWKKKLEKCLKNGTKTRCKNNKCNRECGCFQKWVEQKKKKEWGKIIEHFYKQEGIPPGTHDITLEGVLKKEVLLTSLQEGYGNAEDIEHIKQLLEEEENEENEGTPGADNKNKNTIDKLLDHEEGIAKECQQKQNECPKKPPKKTPGGPDRALKPEEVDASSEDHYDEEGGEDEEEEEDKEEEGEDGEDVQDDVAEEDTAKEEGSSTTETQLPDACNIVKTLFESTKNFEDACRQKYGPKAPTSWKCVPTTGDKDGATGKSDGSICVPPRRRRLYIHKVDDNVKDDASLRKWFIESSAVETFFLWHEYKMEKKREDIEKQKANEKVVDTSNVGEELQNDLEGNGTIPEEFKRQMFYTLGDYKDIFEGKSIEVGDEKDKQKMKEIEKKIQAHINSGSSSPPHGTPGQPNSVTTPQQTWWSRNAPSIWKGMICALTYKEDGEKSTDDKTTLKRNDDVYEKIFGKPPNNDNPQNPNNGTFHKKYHYDSVRLKDDDDQSGDKLQSTSAPSDTPTLNNPKLSDFVLRPTYFRYLEEWGESFCGTRKRMLEQLEKVCRSGETGKEHCSGDGHVCEKDYLNHNNMFADSYCPDCKKACRKYKKWIEKKLEEFQKQKDKYKGELDKLTKDKSGGDKKFCEEIKNHSSAANFLKELKHGKDNQGNSDQDNKLDFENIPQTFSRSTYCKTCPPNKVNCSSGSKSRTSGGTNRCTEVKKNGETWEKVFDKIAKNNGKTTTIDVHMIDRRAPFIKKYLENSKNSEESNNSLFKDSYLFKSVRDQNWECKFENENKDVCKLKNFNDKIDLNQYTTFKVLLIYWLEDFIEGYYILKKRKVFEQCKENGENTCSEESKNYCACVKVWLEKKKNEWEQIKKHFKDRKSDDGDTVVSKVRNFLETLIPRIAPKKNNGEVTELSDLEKSLGCNCAGRAENSKEDEKEDVVLCLLTKLEDKANKCKEDQKPNGENQAQTCEKSAPVEDEDDEPLEEENPVTQPNICPKVETTEETVDEGKCEEDTVTPSLGPKDDSEKDEKKEENSEDTTAAEGEENGAPGSSGTPPPPPAAPPSTPAKTKESKKPKSTKKPRIKTLNVLDHPAVIPALMSSTIMWSIGIGFATFTYFYLKVLYIYINIYGCGCMWMYMYLWGVFGCIYIYLCICGCICVFGYIYIYICISVSVYVCLSVWIYIWIYIYFFYIYFIYIYLY